MGALSVSWRRVALVVGLTSVVTSCRQQVFEPVNNALIRTAMLQGDVQVVTKADLLFVVDDSTSMASKQPKIAAGLPALLTKLDALDPPVDYRVAVMTFSVEERFGPCDDTDPNAPLECSADFGQTGYRCEENECVRRFPQLAGKLVAAPGNPTVLERSQLSLADLEQKFTENVEVGTNGSKQEQPLRALKLALTSDSLKGFLRDDARLVVFLATDTDDCSDSTETLMAQELVNGQIIDNCAAQSALGGSKLDSVDDWLKMFQSLKTSTGAKREVALGAAIGLTPGTATPGTCTDPMCANDCRGPQHQADCNQQCQGSLDVNRCVNECVDQCVLFCGSQDPGRRIGYAVNVMDGVLASICDSDYGPALSRLARVIGIPEAIDLPSVPADDRTFFFTVTRAGRTIHCQEGPDFTLNLTATPPEMDIVQSGACRLLPGDHWSINYVVQSQ